jgi:Protein of unknown function (DUF3833)
MSAINKFSGTLPLFLPERFFNGRVEGWVLVEKLFGGLRNRATIVGEGMWDEAVRTLTFAETYTFDDGDSDTFNWRIRKIAEGRYSGSETRIKGEAIGEHAGCAFHWKYSRDTPQSDGSSMVLNFDDWFYAITEQVCIVRGCIGRAGLPLSIAHVTYRRV